MKPSNYTFPFGQPIIPVKQVEDGQTKKLFILGVYASAVHVKWYGIDGKLRIRAMAVASEPEIFWRGDNEYVQEVIKRINLAPMYGHLEPADAEFNGPSEICLDKNYIHPLGLTRDIHALPRIHTDGVCLKDVARLFMRQAATLHVVGVVGKVNLRAVVDTPFESALLLLAQEGQQRRSVMAPS